MERNWNSTKGEHSSSVYLCFVQFNISVILTFIQCRRIFAVAKQMALDMSHCSKPKQMALERAHCSEPKQMALERAHCSEPKQMALEMAYCRETKQMALEIAQCRLFVKCLPYGRVFRISVLVLSSLYFILCIIILRYYNFCYKTWEEAMLRAGQPTNSCLISDRITRSDSSPVYPDEFWCHPAALFNGHRRILHHR